MAKNCFFFFFIQIIYIDIDKKQIPRSDFIFSHAKTTKCKRVSRERFEHAATSVNDKFIVSSRKKKKNDLLQTRIKVTEEEYKRYRQWSNSESK